MLTFRPHILKWKTPEGESTQDPITHYPIAGAPGEEKQVECRWHLAGTKEYRNEDNSTSRQIGRIRIDNDDETLVVGLHVQVVEGDIIHFSGIIREIYRGQFNCRIDV